MKSRGKFRSNMAWKKCIYRARMKRQEYVIEPLINFYSKTRTVLLSKIRSFVIFRNICTVVLADVSRVS